MTLMHFHGSGSIRRLFICSSRKGRASHSSPQQPHRIPAKKNPHTWTELISKHANRRQGKEALFLYYQMREEGIIPNNYTFANALKACSSISDLEDGKRIHYHVIKSGYQQDIFIASTLVDMYSTCGRIEEARQIFDNMTSRNIVSWNAMIKGYAQLQMGDLAQQLYARMQCEGLTPNARTFVAVLKACASLAAQEDGKEINATLTRENCLDQGRKIHSELAKQELESNMFIASALVDMYAKCESLEDARHVFDKTKHRDVVCWTAMIMGYAEMDMGDLALELYFRMQDEGIRPDSHAFVAALKACGSLATQEAANGMDMTFLRTRYLEQGRAIHTDLAKRGFEADIFVANTLMDMYIKCGSIEDALWVFEKMTSRDVASWTTMIKGYTQMQMGGLALELYACMAREGVMPDARTYVAAIKGCCSLAAQHEGEGVDDEPLRKGYLEQGKAIHAELRERGFASDMFVQSTLVDMYAQYGSTEDARQIFEKMRRRDVVAWNAMIMGYLHIERGDLALELYACMQDEGFIPTARTFVAALKACGSIAFLEGGRHIHSQIHNVGLENQLFIASCLVDMYGKCGSMVDAQQLFDSFYMKDSVTWNALISGYSGQGDSQCTFDLYQKMKQEGLEPDGITFASVLTVCSHNGLVDKGQMYFRSMCLEHNVTPSNKHYRCMADLLGRAGQLDVTVAVVKCLPFKPDIMTWITILGACRKWNNVEIAENAFKCAVVLDKKSAAAYALMLNIYVSAHMWENSARIHEMRIKVQPSKKPGQCWWTDDAGVMHTFQVGNKSHPQSKEIYEKLKDLYVKMGEYMPDLDIMPLCISDKHNDDVLCGHSEKWAIACALINSQSKTTIRIAKNLEICVDCHNVIVLISKIEQRTIICRDASRFHIVKDGRCSCWAL